MKSLHIGLFGRFFMLFALSTLTLVAFVLLGIFSMSEDDARDYLVENETVFQEMLETIAREPLDIEKLKQDAKDNRVELLVVKAGDSWSTSKAFPEIETILQQSEQIGSLFFTQHEGKYYLTAQHENHYASVTSNIMNLIIYPNWLAYWPWVVVVLILLISYGVLRRLLNPINLAIQSAERLSRGELDYQIEHHPKTELSALTRGLNQMARNLNLMFNAQNDLLLAISHELRSPLARMKVSLAMLDNNEVAEGLGQDIKHMDDLIAQLLEGERLKRGHAILDITSFYFPKLIDDLLAEAMIREQVNLVGKVPEIAMNIDVGRIMFALRNLLKNAIEHSTENIPVELSAVELSAVELSVIEQESALIIQVRDSGQGIPEEFLERVFEPFFRIESIENRSFNGVGLGLFLCKRIAEAHQGELEVRNHPERGCIFTMILPIQ